MSEPTTHNIVILGGSFAGLPTAHGLLKALPAVKKATNKDYKVILVSNSSHFWFSVGAPRAMLKPFPNDIMDSFVPISKGFFKYPSSDFEFVFGDVTAVDTDSKNISYKAKNENDEVAERTSALRYDTLVIATGATGPSPLYSLHGSHVPTLNAYKDLHARVPGAKSVMVVGGGTAGVETAGELAYMYGKGTKEPKEIIIYSGAPRLLMGLQPGIGAKAENILESMGVQVVHGVRSESTTVLPSGQTEIKMNNGETKTVDVLIVATGRRPHAPFLPATIPVNDAGKIETDAYLRVPSLKGVYAVGDVSSQSNGTAMFVNFSTPVVIGNIVAELSDKGVGKEYKPLTTKDMALVPVGPQDGVGAVFGWKVPAWFVKMAKGKTMMFSQAVSTVMG